MGMGIPQGDWIVVQRKVRDTHSRGDIRRAGLKEEWAKRIAKENNEANTRLTHNWWAMHKSQY